MGVVNPGVRDTYQNLRLRAESLTSLASGGEVSGDERSVKGLILVRAPLSGPRLR
jgi:hypothetical protein